MVRKTVHGILNAGVALMMSVAPVHAAPDQIGTIIDSAQAEVEEWADGSGDLPVSFLRGDASGILLYAEGVPASERDILCEDLGLSDLVEMLPHGMGKEVVPLSPHHAEVRYRIETSCLVRPGDRFLAVGPGTQEWVSIGKLEARKAPWSCPGKAVWGLWGRLVEERSKSPLFYVSGVGWPGGDNYFEGAADEAGPNPPAAPPEIDPPILKEHLFFPDDFHLHAVYTVPDERGHLWKATRRRVSLDDRDLPNEGLIWIEPDRHQVLLMESVDLEHGSGRVYFKGAFDPNADGWVDFWLSATHAQCPTSALFLGSEEGFWRPPLPVLPCGCPAD